MITPKRHNLAFQVYVLAICAAWAGVLVATLWGLDWRWIPSTFAAAVVLLIAGGLVENRLQERAEEQELIRRLEEAKSKPGWVLPHIDTHTSSATPS